MKSASTLSLLSPKGTRPPKKDAKKKPKDAKGKTRLESKKGGELMRC
jgi:hypothetical protein